MGTILDRIISEKQKEIQHLKNLERVSVMNDIKRKSILARLENESHLAVIAEFKRASPSKGDINIGLDPVLQAKKYEQYGAAAISVLTDSTFFKGSFLDLKAVSEVVDIPVLCKDFIIDRVQIDLAKEHGASIVLLIAAALTNEELRDLYEYARLQNLEVLVEVHDEEDVEKALLLGPRLIGINNRNLKTFEVNLDVTERLVPLVKHTGAYVISESGIFTESDAEKVRNAGAHGVLVGESLMRSLDLSGNLHELRVPLRKVAKK
jgi:indole-3-glycerol phosphate synthase